MGRRGPAAKPPALKLLEGNPGRRPIPDDIPKPRPVAPECPEWLDDFAKEEWQRVVPELDALGLLTIVDGTALAGYCVSYSEWRRAQQILQRRGRVMRLKQSDKKGGGYYYQARPEVAIAKTALQQVKMFCAEFGLTPSARGRMSVPKVKEDPDCARCGMPEAMCGCG